MIWNEIQGIKALATRPPAAAADMNETLRETIRTLREPTDKTAQPLRLDRSHIFLLSPQPLGELGSGDDFSPVDINAVCTAVVPYYCSMSEASNIWVLPRTLSQTCFKPEVILTDSTHLIDQATDLMSYARDGRSFGTITDFSLDIRPRQDCTIENVLGVTSSTKLKAGQTISALVRVKIPAVPTNDRRNSRRDSTTELEDAFTDLEILLGEVVTEVLEVKARYRQSCFPDNILMTVEHICTVYRPNPLSHWSIGPQNDSSVISRIETELYQRFVFLIATQDPPAVALDALGTFYQNKLCSLPCSGYIERVRQELIYQMGAAPLSAKSSANTSASSTLQYSPKFQDVSGIHTSSYAKEDCYSPSVRHSPSQPHFSFEARDSLRFTAQLPTAQRSISASPLTDTHRSNTRAFPSDPNALDAGNTATEDSGKCMSTSDDAESSSVDEARAIWRHMRRNVSIRASSPSRGRPSWPTGYRSVGQRQEMAREHRERELKKKALANKRSIGADTLRSMVIGSEAGGNEAGAALWL